MAMPFVVEGPEIKRERQGEHVLIDGSAEIQSLGYYTTRSRRLFWATESQVQTHVNAVIGSGWVIDGNPSMTPINPPLDLYNAELTFHMYTAT